MHSDVVRALRRSRSVLMLSCPGLPKGLLYRCRRRLPLFRRNSSGRSPPWSPPRTLFHFALCMFDLRKPMSFLRSAPPGGWFDLTLVSPPECRRRNPQAVAQVAGQKRILAEPLHAQVLSTGVEPVDRCSTEDCHAQPNTIYAFNE